MKHAPGLHALVFGMHGLLVAMHLGLLIIGQYGLEGRVRVPVGRPTTVLSLVINISSQTFAIVGPSYFTAANAHPSLLRFTLQPCCTSRKESHSAEFCGLGREH
jgi:hypothetical protein